LRHVKELLSRFTHPAWFCGLSSPELHIARVPHAAYVEVYDNSAKATTDGTVPDPVLVLEMEGGQVISPVRDDLKALQHIPEWTKSILEAALRSPRARGGRLP